MMSYAAGVLFLFSLSIASISDGRNIIKLPSEALEISGNGGAGAGAGADEDSTGTRWAVLLAGSSGYWNYRHQVIISPSNNLFILVTFSVRRDKKLDFNRDRSGFSFDFLAENLN